MLTNWTFIYVAYVLLSPTSLAQCRQSLEFIAAESSDKSKLIKNKRQDFSLFDINKYSRDPDLLSESLCGFQ